MPENIQIVLVEPGRTVSNADGGAQASEVRHSVWANRRDGTGDTFVEGRTRTVDSETIFRIRDFGPNGLRPTTDWRLIDLFDENREYRIAHVGRVRSRGGQGRSTHFDLHGYSRGRVAA